MELPCVSAEETLPEDHEQAVLVGRVWLDDVGPSVVCIEDGDVLDLTPEFATMSRLLEADSPVEAVRAAAKVNLGSLDTFLERRSGHLLAPCDLQNIKACGVTFVDSMLERFVEERAQGDPARAGDIRSALLSQIGGDLSSVVPGSEAAGRIKSHLLAQGLWSQYLEVGLGKDAEVFTKAQPMSAVGTACNVGLLPESVWNNPEPELVLAVNSRGAIVGAALGNDVNLRDIEGRSALLLGRAKDNNGSCAIGPFIRLLGGDFDVDVLRRLEIGLQVEGRDGFSLDAKSDMSRISRDIEDLVRHVRGDHHQYPDGFMLFTGTLYAPTEDRGGAGSGFTHAVGDRVTIRSAALGALINRVDLCTVIPPWTFGVGALLANLAGRGVLHTRRSEAWHGEAR